MNIMDEVAKQTADAVQWRGLGFNPAPGDLAAAEALATKMNRTATYLRETYEVLHKIQNKEDVWRGEAASKFTEKLGELPRYLNNAQQSMGKVAKLLTEWHDQLAGYQKTANELEQRARIARAQYDGAEQARTQAQENTALNLVGKVFSTEEQAAAAQAQYDGAAKQLNAASTAASTAYDSLQKLIGEAKTLQGKHLGKEAETAGGVRRADDGLAPELGFWEGLGEVLDVIGDIAGVAAGVLGGLALLVAGPVIGPLAILASSVALVAHGSSMAATGEFDPVTLAGDALGMIPGVSTVKASFKAVEGAGQVTIKSLVPVAREIGKRMEEPTILFSKLGMGVQRALKVEGIAKPVAQIAESSTSFGLQVPAVAGWAKGQDDPVVQTMQGIGGFAGVANTGNSVGNTLYPTIGKLVNAID